MKQYAYNCGDLFDTKNDVQLRKHDIAAEYPLLALLYHESLVYHAVRTVSMDHRCSPLERYDDTLVLGFGTGESVRVECRLSSYDSVLYPCKVDQECELAPQSHQRVDSVIVVVS